MRGYHVGALHGHGQAPLVLLERAGELHIVGAHLEAALAALGRGSGGVGLLGLLALGCRGFFLCLGFGLRGGNLLVDELLDLLVEAVVLALLALELALDGSLLFLQTADERLLLGLLGGEGLLLVLTLGEQLGLAGFQLGKLGTLLLQLLLLGLNLAPHLRLKVGILAEVAHTTVHLAEGVGREEEEQTVFERIAMERLAEGAGIAALAHLEVGFQLLQFAAEEGDFGFGSLQLIAQLGDKLGLLTDALAEHGELRQLALDILACGGQQLLRLLDLLLQTGTVFLHLLYRLGTRWRHKKCRNEE